MVSSGIWSYGDNNFAVPPLYENVHQGFIAGNSYAIRHEQFLNSVADSHPDNQDGHEHSTIRMSASSNFDSSIISSSSASLITPAPPVEASNDEAKARGILNTVERQPRPQGTIFPFGISSLSAYTDSKAALHLDFSSSDEEKRTWKSDNGGK